MQDLVLTPVPLNELLDKIAERVVARLLIVERPKQEPEPEDRIDIYEVCKITNLRKPTIYKGTSLGLIPCDRIGKRLVFSRRKIAAWIEGRTVHKEPIADIAARHLQNQVNTMA